MSLIFHFQLEKNTWKHSKEQSKRCFFFCKQRTLKMKAFRPKYLIFNKRNKLVQIQILMLIHLFTAFPCSSQPPTGKQKMGWGGGDQTASAPSDLPWVLKIYMQEHTKRVGKSTHVLLISVSTDMNYASFAQSKCQHNHIFFLKRNLDHWDDTKHTLTTKLALKTALW